jgi:uncharacterized protein YkwD
MGLVWGVGMSFLVSRSQARWPLVLGLAGALFFASSMMIGSGRHADAIANCSVTHDATDGEELAFLGLINQYRQQNGLGALTVSTNLNREAAWMAQDLADNNYFSHTDSLGRSPFARAIDCGYPSGAGENLAAGTAWNTAQAAMDAWKSSPGHNANMLNGMYQQIGIARYYKAGSQYTWYWATDFGAVNDGTGGGGGGAPTNTPTNTPTSAPPTNTPTQRPPTNTPTQPAATSTPTAAAPTSTPTSGSGASATPTQPLPTSTPTTAASTASPTATQAQATSTPTQNATPGASSTPTSSPSATPTQQPTSTPQPTATPTNSNPANSLPLSPGANLVAWPGGAVSAADAFGNSTTVAVVYEWDPATNSWKRYFPGLPAFLNNLGTLRPGNAYWVIAKGKSNLVIER